MLSQDQRVNMLMAQVDDLRNVLGRNVNLLIQQETKINSLIEKSEQTKKDSLVFKRKSIRMKREQRNKSFKLSILIAGGGVLLLLILITLIAKSGWLQTSS